MLDRYEVIGQRGHNERSTISLQRHLIRPSDLRLSLLAMQEIRLMIAPLYPDDQYQDPFKGRGAHLPLNNPICQATRVFPSIVRCVRLEGFYGMIPPPWTANVPEAFAG
jgi:hypothetical protein